jgi:hypothetical protein
LVAPARRKTAASRSRDVNRVNSAILNTGVRMAEEEGFEPPRAFRL